MTIDARLTGVRQRASPRRLAGWRRGRGIVLYGVLAGAAALAAIGIGAPLLARSGPDEQHLEEALQPPSAEHLFGTDDLGRDILTRVLYGARYTLTLALSVVAVACAAGTVIGGSSGYLGGWFDEGTMRLAELVMAFPAIILAMAIVVALGPGLVNAGLAMVLVWWPPYARLARAEVLAVKHLEYVEAAAALGQTSLGILRRSILGTMLGRIERRKMPNEVCPSAAAASTYSRCFTASTSARASRAYGGHHTRTIDSPALTSPGPSATTIAMARMIAGKAMTSSARRIIPSSNQPPR